MSTAPFLELEGLRKSFGDTQVLEELSLSLAEGEILALLGLSGSGKTTALRLLAGFERPDAGIVKVAGDEVTALGPVARGFGMVFQHYALFPHMSVAQNVAFGLEARGLKRPEIDERVAEMLALVDLADYGQRRVSAISGGQQQRVALARALAPEPRLLLLDEPLSNLDPALRERTRSELRAAVKRIGITTVLVTHEQEEAFHVGDRVAVLNAGRLEQIGSAQQLYRHPTSRFVAGFIGRSSSLSGVAEQGAKAGTELWVRLGDTSQSSDPRQIEHGSTVSWAGNAVSSVAEGEEVELIVRPESLKLAEVDLPGGLAGHATGLRFTGALSYALIEVPGLGELEVLVDDDFKAAGQPVRVAPRGDGPEPRAFPRESA